MTEQAKVEKIRLQNKKFTWVSINKPDEKSIKYLKNTYKFHHLDLEDCLSDIHQRPKIDDYEKYLFIILHAPIKTGNRKSLKTSEIHIFIGENFIITLHQNNALINSLYQKCKKSKKAKEEYMGKGTGYFLYMIIDDLFEAGYPLVDELSAQLNELEKDVFDEDHSRDRLKEILSLKKNIINLRRIIMPQRAIIAQLEHKNKKFLPENLDVYFDDIVDKIEKLWSNLENLQELVASLQETNESIISHNTNNVIKILTIFSVVMLPLTFMTGFYGMNISTLPFAENPHSLLIISGIIIAIAVTMIAYFKYRKWL
jgi:magnesium transporter